MRASERCRLLHSVANAVLFLFDYLPEDGLKGSKHVENLLYNCTLLCQIVVELLEKNIEL